MEVVRIKIERPGLTPIIKRSIDLSNLDEYSQAKIDSVTPFLRETIEGYPISTFGLITLLRKSFENDLLETFNNLNLTNLSINYNCFYLSTVLRERLKQESIDTYLMTYKANKYSTSSGDDKLKEAHISLVYPTIRNGSVHYTIFDSGLKIDRPLSFYQKTSSRGIIVDKNKIDICYDPNDAEYPYYMDMVGINRYSYNKTDHRIFQRFNPSFETLNIDEMLFPVSYQILTGYKAIVYSTDPNKRAYITLSHLDQNLSFSDCITGMEYQFTYDELEKMGYAKVKTKLSSVCDKLQLDSDDMTSNIFFMMYYHDDYIKCIMDRDVLREYSQSGKKRILDRKNKPIKL